MTYRNATLGAAMALGLALVGTAAQADTAGKSRMFQALDKDSDGVVTREEVQAAQDDHFARLDQNSDGSISREEFGARANEHFSRFDLDGDGGVTEQEAQEARAQFKKSKETQQDN